MGCASSCMQRTTMLFNRRSSVDNESRAKVERKLYLAKESPDPDFDISDCQLRQVPSGIYSICKVIRKENIYLNNNNLQSLDDGGQLADLYLTKIIDISCNRFSELPHDIRYLVNLTELYVQDNQIKHLPESIQYLQNLQVLNVSKNCLCKLTSSIGKLKKLRKINISENRELTALCPELCMASNLIYLELDAERYKFPPADIVALGLTEIMKYLCKEMKIDYCPPNLTDSEISTIQVPNSTIDPFAKCPTISWEEQEAAVKEQENRIHEAAKRQRAKFLSGILQEQSLLDKEISKVQECKEIEKQRLIKAIQADEKEIECLVRNFIQTDKQKPEVIQQQLAHEQAEHDRLLEMSRQSYVDVKKTDILKAMEQLIEEQYSIQHTKKSYDDRVNTVKQSLLMDELDCTEKLKDFLKAKDESRSALVNQLLEDQDVQKAVVASLVERVDARSWSLNEEISLISSNLARLSIIEQEKKKLQVTYNYNELLQQRIQLVILLDDLLDQQTKRRKQLVETLKQIESENDFTTDFWLKNYQKLINSAPKSLLHIQKRLDPVLANYLLEEGVIHSLPFLVKFLFSDDSLLNITSDDLKENGVTLLSDREGILKALHRYVNEKSNSNQNYMLKEKSVASAPSEDEVQKETCTGVVSTVVDNSMESECVVCMDAKCEVVFVPCGHMCCCQLCAEKDVESCPMCRSDIERKIKVMVA